MWASVLAVTLAALPCCKRTQGEETARGTSSSEDAPRPPPRQRLGDDELQAFAETLLDEVKRGRADAASAFIDWQLLFARATAGLALPAEAQRGFLEKVPSRTLFHQMVADVRAGGFLSLLRKHDEGRGQHLLYRQIHAEGGFDYVDLTVERSTDGRPIVTDFYVVDVGEPIGRTVRAQMLPFAGPSSTWTSTDRASVDHAAAIQALGNLVGGKRFAEALDAYAKLPAPAQSLESVQRLRATAAQHTSADAYAAALDDLTLRFPDAADVWVRVLANALEQGKLTEALEAVNGIERSIGGDPYLDVQRSNVHAAAGDLHEALSAAKKAAPAIDVVVGYLTVVATSLRAEAFDDTLWALRALHTRHRFDMGDLVSDPEFAGFRRSPRYAEWLKSRAPSVPAP